jgi:hypothetical protein
MSKDKINAFSVSKHKGGNVFWYVFELLGFFRFFFWNTVQTGSLYFYRTLWKGFGNTQELLKSLRRSQGVFQKGKFWNGFENTQEEKMFLSLFLV